MRGFQFSSILPFLAWLKAYSFSSLRIDLVSGLSVGLVLIPQSMANAQLAGLPAHYGLYASLFPTIVSGLFSSSRHMCTGMVALVAMMTAAALEPLAVAGSQGYIAYAVILAFMVGVIQIALRLFRLVFLVNFLSHPVIMGFNNAALLLIAFSQLSKIFGVSVEAGNTQAQTLFRVLKAATTDMHWPTFGLALLAGLLIYTIPKINKKLPAVLCAVIITTIISWAINYNETRTISASELRGVGFHLTLNELASTQQALSVIQGERSDVYNDMQKQSFEDKASRLNSQYHMDQLDLMIKRMQLGASINRLTLRKYTFKEVEEDGRSFFMESSEIDKDMTLLSDKEWRLKLSADREGDTSFTILTGGAVVGAIPPGLPTFMLPDVDSNVIMQLLPFAIAIAFIGLASSLSVAKTIARSTGDKINNKQEFLAQGLANIVSGLSQSGPVAGSFSSSAVNFKLGAKTGLAAIFGGCTTLLTLVFLTPYLYHLPISVLAAIVISAMVFQVKFTIFWREWRTVKTDGAIAVATFLATLIFAPQLDVGLMIGVGLSMVAFLYRSMHPAISTLNYGPQGRVCDYSILPQDYPRCEYISVLRFEQALFFINSNVLEEYILALMAKKPELKHIHLVCTGINEIDASGEDSLVMLVRWIRKAGLTITLNGLNEKVRTVLERTGLLQEVGEENIFHTMQEGICVAHGRITEAEPEHHCPWNHFCE